MRMRHRCDATADDEKASEASRPAHPGGGPFGVSTGRGGFSPTGVRTPTELRRAGDARVPRRSGSLGDGVDALREDDTGRRAERGEHARDLCHALDAQRRVLREAALDESGYLPWHLWFVGV